MRDNIFMIKKKVLGRPKERSSLEGRNFFLTVPHFEGTIDMVLDALKRYQESWQYVKYAVVIQTHKDENSKHLHLYLSYPKRLKLKVDMFDYLGKHGKLERVREYRSVLKYMTKEARPRANFDYLEEIMKVDFSRAMDILLSQGYTIRQIFKQYSSIVPSKNWQGYLRFKQYSIESAKIQAELDKPGLRMITPELIRAQLSDQEYTLFKSDDIYMRIVDKINDIVLYKCHRPHKAKALFLSGEPNTGKTTLGLALQSYVGTFTFPDDGWWQGYESDVFQMILWNQFDLRRFAYPTLLKFLEGLRMDLPIKGSHVTRFDNPLIFLTSNLTLDELICKRFSSQQNRIKSRTNLKVRIEQINIGSNPIFFLLKLLVKPTENI